MFSLLFLGGFLERIIGKKRFIWIFMVSGIVGSLLYILNFYLTGNGDIPAVGASGAIFGLGGMLAVITPRMPVYIMFIPIAMPMWVGVTLSLALLWFLSIAAGLPIGNLAHLGGLIAGLGYAVYLRTKYKRRFDMISHYFS
jgi:membrane associated rhomboid family serine protease